MQAGGVVWTGAVEMALVRTKGVSVRTRSPRVAWLDDGPDGLRG